MPCSKSVVRPEPVRRAPSRSVARRGLPAGLRRRDRLAQLAPAQSGGPAREGRSHRFLDLHLHQLAAHARLCPRVGHEVRGSGVGRGRRPHAGVPVRTRRRQRSLGREEHARRVSDRARQRLRGVARIREQLLAGRTSPTRKDESGITSSARVGTKSANGSSSDCCARREPTTSRTTSSPSPTTDSKPKRIGRTWRPRRRTWATSKRRTSRPRAVPTSTNLAGTSCRSRCGSITGLSRATGRSKGGRACCSGRWANRVPLPRPRRSSRHGPARARDTRAVQSAGRRRISRRCARARRRRRRPRDAVATAAPPADPPAAIGH